MTNRSNLALLAAVQLGLAAFFALGTVRYKLSGHQIFFVTAGTVAFAATVLLVVALIVWIAARRHDTAYRELERQVRGTAAAPPGP